MQPEDESGWGRKGWGVRTAVGLWLPNLLRNFCMGLSDGARFPPASPLKIPKMGIQFTFL